MKNYISRNGNKMYQYDMDGKLLHVFCSKYAAAKWVIDHGHSSMEKCTKSYCRAAGAFKKRFNKSKTSTIISHGFKWEHGEKFENGEQYDDTVPLSTTYQVVCLFRNGHVKLFDTVYDVKTYFKTEKVILNRIDDQQWHDIEGKTISLFYNDGGVCEFPSLKMACNTMKIDKNTLKKAMDSGELIRGKTVKISTH